MSRRISTISLLHRPAARLVLGLVLAGFAQLLAIFLAGAGHGWVAPLYLSVALWFLIPPTLLVAWPTHSPARLAMIAIAAFALAANALLASRAWGEVAAIRFYLEINGGFGWTILGLWLSLWFGWQVILFYSLLTGHADD